MGTGTSAPQINVTAGKVYRESAWVKISGQTGRTITFADGFYNSSGTWLGWTSGATVTLAATSGFQYVEDQITAPTGAAYMLGSPRITEGNVAAAESLWIDEVVVAPLRAATMIGAETPDGNCDSSNFSSIDSSIGPLQTCKVFYGPSTPLPAFAGSICDNLPVSVTCVISFKDDSGLASFVSHIPARRNVVLVYWQEPEHTWSGGCPLPTCTGATYVSQFETEADTIRANVTSSNAENVFIASDAEAYQYDATTSTHHNGTSCSYIPPSGNVGSPDFYFMDQYELPPTSDNKNLGNDTAVDVSTETNNWLSCATPNNKPLGVAELGYNCGASTGNNVNTSVTTDNMGKDNTYLGANPDGLPVVLEEYWYDDNVGCKFTLSSAVSEWKSIETQNGGGAN